MSSCIRPATARHFFGRTPERLLKLDGRAICVDAIAGTRPRGKDASEDRSLESELLQSPKEMAEHRIVSRYIEDRMNRIARHQQDGFPGIHSQTQTPPAYFYPAPGDSCVTGTMFWIP